MAFPISNVQFFPIKLLIAERRTNNYIYIPYSVSNIPYSGLLVKATVKYNDKQNYITFYIVKDLNEQAIVRYYLISIRMEMGPRFCPTIFAVFIP